MADNNVVIDVDIKVNDKALTKSADSAEKYFNKFATEARNQLGTVGDKLDEAVEKAKGANFKDSDLNKEVVELGNLYKQTFDSVTNNFDVMMEHIMSANKDWSENLRNTASIEKKSLSENAYPELKDAQKYIEQAGGEPFKLERPKYELDKTSLTTTTDDESLEAVDKNGYKVAAKELYNEKQHELNTLYKQLTSETNAMSKNASKSTTTDTMMNESADKAIEKYVKLDDLITEITNALNQAIEVNIDDSAAVTSLTKILNMVLDTKTEADKLADSIDKSLETYGNTKESRTKSNEPKSNEPENPESDNRYFKPYTPEPEKEPTVVTKENTPLEQPKDDSYYRDVVQSINEARKAASLLGDIFSGISGTVQSIVSGVQSIVGRVQTIANITKSKITTGVKEIFKDLDKGFKFFTKYVLGLRSTFFLIRKIRSFALGGFTNLAKGADAVQHELDMWKGTLEAVKLSLGTIIQPIAAAFIPALKTVTSLISSVAAKMASFFAILTGQKYIYKASGSLEDYAEQLDNIAANAKKVKNQLASFDEMNVLEDNTDSNEIDYSQLVSKVQVDQNSAVADFANMVKEAWKNGDFTEVGQIIAEKLRDALNSIPWSIVNAAAQKLAKSLGTLINGFVETEDIGGSIGRTIGNGLMTWVNTSSKFFSTVHWDSIGRALNDGLAGAVSVIDPVKLGLFLVEKFNAMFETLSGFLTNGKTFTDLGTKIGATLMSAIKRFNWEENAYTIGQLIIRGLETAIAAIKEINVEGGIHVLFVRIKQAIQNFPWSEIGTKIGELLSSINWTQTLGDLTKIGKEIIQGLWTALKNAVEQEPGLGLVIGGVIVSKLLGGLSGLFLNGLTGKYGVAISKSIIDGLGGKSITDAISGGLSKAVTGATGGITNAFNGIGSIIKNAASKSINEIIMDTFLTPIFNVFSEGGILGIVKSGMGTFVDLLASAINPMMTLIAHPFTLVETLMKGLEAFWSSGAGPIALVALTIVALTQLWNESKTFRDNVKKMFDNIMSIINEVYNDVIKPIVDIVMKHVDTLWKNSLKPLWDNFKQLVSFIASAVMGVIDVCTPYIKLVIDVFGTVLVGVFNVFMSAVDAAISFIIMIINSFISVINLLLAVAQPIFSVIGTLFKTLGIVIQGVWDSMLKPAFNLVSGAFSGIFDVASSAFKGVAKIVTSILQPAIDKIGSSFSKLYKEVIKPTINAGLGAFESFANGIIDAFNSVVKFIDKFNFTIPKGIPGVGGTKIGISIGTMKHVSIPRLAEGTVIPANKEFLAVLGDQKSGTNIEAPLDTIKQAVAEVLATNTDTTTGDVNLDITLQVGDRELYKWFKKMQQQEKLILNGR